MTTNGQMTDAEARRLSGDGADTPPYLELPPRSEGDLRKNSYRPSRWGRLSTGAVVNDDGTAITAEAERKLDLILGVLTDIRAVMREINARGERVEKVI